MELLDMLHMIRDCCAPREEARLMDEYGLSFDDLCDWMEEAHNMGAVIKRHIMDGRYYWTCVNWGEVEEAGILRDWIHREEAKLP